ncbi:addiction module antidote protein [Methylobacterium oryzisoli]|uniref:addiction module antidote protein n=1 Tax=Methylobacterium oryzisoli TaxID=3385502 RepID=UPI00389265E4
MTGETREWDPVRYLRDDEDVLAYLDAAFEDGDPALIAAAIGDVARARGMAKVAQETGKSRENLYRALSGQGDPQLSTFVSVLGALGLKLRVHKAEA